VAEPAVVNASPIIVLVRAGYLELLRQAGEQLIVPAAVASELEHRGPDDPAVRALASTAWLTVVDTPAIPAVIAACDLGPGETAVLAWALAHPGTEAIIDDLDARRAALDLGIAVVGCVGLVLRARRSGVLRLARPVLESLRRSGLYLAQRALDDALALVGE
jgi:predicted nucleic acid-binding protein